MAGPSDAATVRAEDDDRRRPAFQQLHPNGRRMLTVDQAADFLNTTERIVRRLIDTGELKAVKYSERNTRISERALVAFLDRT